MMSLQIDLDSIDKEAYENLQKVVDGFVEELRKKDPEVETVVEAWFNPHLHLLPKPSSRKALLE